MKNEREANLVQILLLRKLLPLPLFLLSGITNASYEMGCTLDGVVVSKPKIQHFNQETGIKQDETQFLFKVTKASVSGRDDGGCVQVFQGKTIEVILVVKEKAIRRNDRLRVGYHAEDYKGIPTTTTFFLVNRITN